LCIFGPLEVKADQWNGEQDQSKYRSLEKVPSFDVMFKPMCTKIIRCICLDINIFVVFFKRLLHLLQAQTFNSELFKRNIAYAPVFVSENAQAQV